MEERKRESKRDRQDEVQVGSSLFDILNWTESKVEQTEEEEEKRREEWEWREGRVLIRSLVVICPSRHEGKKIRIRKRTNSCLLRVYFWQYYP